MSIEIEYYIKESGRCPIVEFMDKLPTETRARTFKTFDLLERFGLQIGMPHLRKIAGMRNAWELRVRSKNDIYRYYFTVIDKKALIVHCLNKKTNKIPYKDLKIIKERLKSLK
ncbi:MAG: type II toxin-antitoxin system RelE/ParE family toxin [Patescibacteria group bacterium]|nr:type II toxin-antitoxin system RelE/ParE family toxin [Patescibacteria group bacterium]